MQQTTNLWATTAGTPIDAPSLDGDITADVVIIGGGFTGLSAALHLAESGASVCLLEAHTVGHGGSGRNVGLVNAGLWTPPDEVEAILGERYGPRLNAVLADGPQTVFALIEKHGIACEAMRKGTLHCAHSAKGLADLENRHAQQQVRQAPVELLDADETARRTGTARYHGALWDRRAGTVQPLAYARGLARAAIAAGIAVHENTPALEITRRSDAWAVRAPGGTVTAKHLIQCTNAYGDTGTHPVRYVPVHYFQIATEPLPPAIRARILASGEGCWDTALVMSSFRLDRAGRLLVGSIGNLEGWGRPVHHSWAQRRMRWLFPWLGNVAIEHAWSGRIAMTRDHVPTVGTIGENAISIHGYSGRGIAPGTVFGACAARWSAGDADAFPIAITEPEGSAFTGVSALYYETGAVLTHMLPH